MDDPDRDSTWEDEEEEEEDGGGPSAGEDDGEAGAPGDAEDEDGDEDEEARPRALQSRMTGSLNWRAMQDTRRYRHHYPDLMEGDSNGDMPNLSFYRNEIQFLPNGCFIEDILQKWRDDYDLLEDNHSYIQWLFPLREPGVNWYAKPLTQREIKAFKSTKEAGERFVQAYELMLGFYGIELEDRDTGKVRRAQSYQKRFQNLNWHSHNNLRITRILKSLGELGLERYQAPLVRFFLEETLVRGELPGVRQSALDYFVFTVRCPRQRRALLRFAWEHFRPRRQFVWAPHDKLRRLRLHSPPRPPLPAGPEQAEGEASPVDAPLKEGAQGRTCGPGEGGDSVAAGPQQPRTEPQEEGAPERDLGEEAGSQGEEGPEPASPKESKKRKLELNRREQAPGELGPQSASEVEKIALNLEGCALSQGSLGAGTQEMGSQEPGETEQPCPPPPRAKVADEVRKRRKVDQTPAPTWPPGPSGRPEAGVGENEVEEEAEGQGVLEQGAPRSPAPAEPALDAGAGAGLAAKPPTP
ncbi:opioid growth factor receptor [Eptesicus fuscus]|uniref:opioid growth factor receptor n=1 Tax=Eptesicus fuscus TaxID=29078 RepID=UPI002403CDD2|nr:opioid growth factor receptor [Eptesicus fuscus]